MGTIYNKMACIFALRAFLIMLISVFLSTSSAIAQVKKDAKVRSYNQDDSVICSANYSYTPAKGCVASRGRISQFSMDGRSPVIGLAQCMPEIALLPSPEVDFTTGFTAYGSGVLDDGMMIKLEDGDVIAVATDTNNIFFRRYNAAMQPQGGVRIAGGFSLNKMFEEYNNLENDNLELIANDFDVAPLDGARWILAMKGRSQNRGEEYVLGAVFNGDDMETPSVEAIDGTDVFPISYEGTLFNDSANKTINNIANIEVEGFKKSDGTRDGRFMVAWQRYDYFQPGQDTSIFGKIFDAVIAESLPSDRFGVEQDSEIRMENSKDALSGVIRLTALRTLQGMALGYNSPAGHATMFPGSTEEGVIRLFDSDGDLYKSGSDIVGVIGDVRRINDIVELTSNRLMVLHRLSSSAGVYKRLSVSMLDVSTASTPVIIDLNGATAGNAQTLRLVSNTIRKPSIEVLPSDRTRVYLTWSESSIPATIRAMMIRYDSGTPQFNVISDWFRVDPGEETSPVYPSQVNSDNERTVSSLHLETVATPLGMEHYFMTRYDRTAGAGVYRRYKVPDCW